MNELIGPHGHEVGEIGLADVSVVEILAADLAVGNARQPLLEHEKRGVWKGLLVPTGSSALAGSSLVARSMRA